MRALIVVDSLKDRALPIGFKGALKRIYPHRINNQIPVEIMELSVADNDAVDNGVLLAEQLVSSRFYAHIVGEDRMYVIFPGVLTIIRRGEADTVDTARKIGIQFGIPDDEMRFAEMFENDHPDATASG